MKDRFKFIVLFLLKILSVVFVLSAIASFIASIIYGVQYSGDDTAGLILFIFSNLAVTLFFRIVMAVFFFAFAIFIEEWLKTE